jgi:hypothetical protein
MELDGITPRPSCSSQVDPNTDQHPGTPPRRPSSTPAPSPVGTSNSCENPPQGFLTPPGSSGGFDTGPSAE